MMEFQDIERARKILKLPKVVTLSEIKKAYRKLTFLHHPDIAPESEKAIRTEKFREIIWARDVLMEYLVSYRYFFSEGEVKKHLGPEDKKFSDQFYVNWF